MSDSEALGRAISAVGGAATVAAMFGITVQAVSQWKKCPPNRARRLAAASGVSEAELCPEVFGEPEAA